MSEKDKKICALNDYCNYCKYWEWNAVESKIKPSKGRCLNENASDIYFSCFYFLKYKDHCDEACSKYEVIIDE